MDFIKQAAVDNNINPQIVDKAFQKFKKQKTLRNITTLNSISNSINKPTIYGKMPYYPKLSEQLQKCSKKHNINLGLQVTNTVKSYMPKIKQINSKYNRNGVYQLNCQDCSKYYIGQTSRTFEKRLKEHEAAIRLKHPDKSHFAKHILEDGHSANISLDNNLKILDYNSDYKIRNFKESFHIKCKKQDGNCVNIDDGPCNSKLIEFAINLLK